jgi:hypothetical protein
MTDKTTRMSVAAAMQKEMFIFVTQLSQLLKTA